MIKFKWSGVDIAAWVKGKRTLLAVSRPAMVKVVSLYGNIIQKHIDNQDLNMPALSPSTVRKKGHDRWYWETGSFYEALGKTTTRNTATMTRVTSGPSLRDRHNPSGMTYALFARRLAFGHGRIPPRDIFTPSRREWEKKHWKPYVETVTKGLHRKTRRKT